MDNINLYKPVFLRGNLGGYTTLKIETQEQQVYGKKLVFRGYLIVQEGAQLRPDELRGILVRVRNVGIGYYDPSMLDYRFNEGPRSRWITGEIFVEEGLEDALNIDRDSFNRFHPQFKAVQEYVHRLLHEEIFPASYKQIDVRSTAKAESKAEVRKEHLRKVISRTVEAPVVIKNETPAAKPDQMPQVTVTEKTSGVEVDLPEAKVFKTKKAHQQLAASILAVFEVAMREKNRDKQREVFTELLQELLAGW